MEPEVEGEQQPSLGYLSDTETKVDLLNNEAMTGAPGSRAFWR